MKKWINCQELITFVYNTIIEEIILKRLIKYRKLKDNISGNDCPDNGLVDAYRKSGNREYIGQLFKRYTHLVYGVCLKYLKDEEMSKDAVMDIFEKLMIDLKKHEIAHFKSWLYQVSKNHCLMQLRKEKKIVSSWDEIDQNRAHFFMESFIKLHHNNGEEEKQNLTGKLYHAINNLNDEQRNCIELMYLKDKSYKEIVDLTGYTMKQVKSFIQNGKRNLKQMLKTKKINR